MTGISDEVDYIADGSLFVHTHLPASGTIGGLVVCSPIHAEFMTNHLREVLLSRTLPGRGIAVQRFNYRGTGQSFGDGGALTFGSMVDDALEAADHLRRRGVESLGFLGTRLGAIVAARAAREVNEAGPVVLWQPVVDPERYFREMLRAALVSDLSKAGGGGRSTASMMDRLRADGSIDVFGYEVDRRLVQSLEGRDLATELGGSGPVLIVQLGRGSELHGEARGLADTLGQRGVMVDGEVVTMNEAWWFASATASPSMTGGVAIELTADWLTPPSGKGRFR